MRNRELREIYSFALEADGKESPKMQSWYFDAGWRLINLSTQKPLWRFLPVPPSGHRVAEEYKEQLPPLTGSSFASSTDDKGRLLFCPRYKRYAKSSGNHPNLTNENVCFMIVRLQLHIQAPANVLQWKICQKKWTKMLELWYMKVHSNI